MPRASVSTEGRARSRRIGVAALLGSLLIHLGLAFVILRFAKPVVPKPAPTAATVEIEVEEVHRPWVASPAASASKAAVEPQPKPAEKTLRGAAGGHPTGQSGSAPVQAIASRSPDQSLHGDVPHRLDLSFHGNFETASPGGETVHNRPGEIEPEGVQRSLAQQRINEWIDDDTARRRVDNGLVDDWFMRLDKSLGHALDEAPATASVADGLVGKLLKKYASAASNYGGTGTPGSSPDPKLEPSASASGPLAPALGTPATFKLQLDSAGLDPWAVIELSYDHGGKLRGSRLLESSGNSDFNFHVLHVVALGLAGLPEAPDGGEGIHPYGTRSVWRITGHLTFERDVRHGLALHDAWALPLSAATSLVGLGGVGFDEVTGYIAYHDWSHPHLHCKVELLQVY